MTILIEINDDDNDYANWLIIMKMMLTILMMMTIDNLSIDGNDFCFCFGFSVAPKPLGSYGDFQLLLVEEDPPHTNIRMYG